MPTGVIATIMLAVMSKPKVKQKYWGLRTLGFLALAAGSLIARNAMILYDVTGFILLPFVGLVIGLIGAAICSYKGIRAMMSGPRLY